jgi:hypothetical protein
MLATELIEKLQQAIFEHGNLPVCDCIDDEIVAVKNKQAETKEYAIGEVVVMTYPDRLVLA